MLKKHLDTLLIVGGFIIIVANVSYLFLTTGPGDPRPLIKLTPAFIALALVLLGMTLMEMKSGEKTLKEAVAEVAIQMLFVALFILIANLLRK